MAQMAESVHESVRDALDTLADEDPPVKDAPKPDEAPVEAAKESPPDDGLPPERIPIPPSWKKEPEWVADWEKTPLDLQKRIYQRETERDRETSRRIQQLAEREKLYGAIEQSLSPHLRDMYAAGVRPEEVIGELMHIYSLANRDKTGAAQYFLARMGLDPQQLIQQVQANPTDPNLAAVQQQIAMIQQALVQREQAETEQYRGWINDEVASFVNATDDKGQPLYPYMEALAADMEPIVKVLREQHPQAHPTQILKAAYDRCYWAHPQIRELEFKRREQARIVEATKKAEAARGRAVQINGAPTGTAAQTAPSSVHASVRQVVEDLGY